MYTRLAAFCYMLLEAGWLAALIVAPLFFNVYSSRVFEPDKITLVRSLALVMGAAWMVLRFELGWKTAQGENGGAISNFREWLRTALRENPLAIPTFAVVAVYLVSTVLSVVPSVSFWGSYQRLQGTDTTFSYIVIFLIAASSIRTRSQFNRTINTALVVSFPIAFYGLIQHYGLDPLPWGGDVRVRITSNMGNAIFVAAYLIMVVPLTVARFIETLVRATAGFATRPRTMYAAGVAIAIGVLAVLWVLDLSLGTAAALVFVGLALGIGWQSKTDLRNSLLAAVYAVLIAVQLVAIFFTQSRGPWLGLAGGLFVFAVLYAILMLDRASRRLRRWLFGGAVGLAFAGMAFLVVFNLPSSPLAALKQVPYVGRLGEILDTKSPTAQVRELIWQGAVQLILPHAPLWSPTAGEDVLNALRPLVGYGPESMYVVYNAFYPPGLGRLEQRNASPDRSHNETFDSLVTTGLLGFGAYILLFMSIFYYGLKWLGVITRPSERNAFVVLWLVGGLLSSLIFIMIRGLYFVGVALPAGMILGFFVFLAGFALGRLRNSSSTGSAVDTPAPAASSPSAVTAGVGQGGASFRTLWLCALIAAIAGHFIEIHFGIAIVSTRLYFWFYVALLVLLGMNHLIETPSAPSAKAPEPVRSESPKTSGRNPARPRKRRRAFETARSPLADKTGQDQVPLFPVLVWTTVTAIIFVTLGFEFIANQSSTPSALDMIVRSLFFKGGTQSPAIFVLFLLTWAVAGAIGLGEELKEEPLARNGVWLTTTLYLVLSFTVLVWFALFLVRTLTQPGDLENAFVGILGLYDVTLFLLVGLLALGLYLKSSPRPSPTLIRSSVNSLAAPALFVIIAALIYFTNYTNVSADILYKAGSGYETAGAWQKSIDTYQRALDLQPTQDFYALFLGRAYLQGARVVTDLAQQAQMLAKSEQVLLKAQRDNPLNTDHTANLARLHREWASLSDDPAQKSLHLGKAIDYYQMATRLSPNTAYLYNEWVMTYLQAGNPPKALEVLNKSLQIDSQYAQTYLYLGEYYRTQHDNENAAVSYLKALSLDPGALSDPDGQLMAGPAGVLSQADTVERAVQAYQAIAAKYQSDKSPVPVTVYYALATLYRQSGQNDLARQQLEQAVEARPGDLNAQLALVNFYSEMGQIDPAVLAMRRVMDLVSPNNALDYQRFQDFYTQLQNLQRAIQAVQKAPNDAAAHRSLAALWKARGQAQFALPEYQTAARLQPNDYDAAKNLVILNLQLSHPDDAERALPAAVALAPDKEKPMWQDLQLAINAQKSRQYDEAVKQTQAAIALAADTDRTVLQAYVSVLQGLTSSGK